MIHFLKRFKFVFIAIALWSCDNKTSKNGAVIDFIPEDASVVFKIDDANASDRGFSSFKNSLRNNSLLSAFRKTAPFIDISEKTPLLDHLNPSVNSILSLNLENDKKASYTFITKMTSGLLLTDSVQNKTIETLTLNNKTIQRITIGSETTYTTVKDSVFIASSSQQLLLDILDGKTQKNKDFLKIYNIKNTNDFSAILKGEVVQISDIDSLNFASYMGLDVSVLPDGLFATGVALARDSVPKLLSVFEGQIPQQNDIAKLIPTKALGALAFTFSDAEVIQSKLKMLSGASVPTNLNELFGSVNEVGEIYLSEGKAIVLKSIDPSLTQEAVAQYLSANGVFREIGLSAFSAPSLFSEAFYPLIRANTYNQMFQLDNFFVFAENKAVTKRIISSYKNNNCLDKASYFEGHQSQLSNASSLLYFKMQGNIPTSLLGFMDTKDASNLPMISLKKYPLAALQFSYDRDFAHVNYICKEASSAKQISSTVSEVFSIELPNELVQDPQLFTNHRTKDKDVVVQDMTNTLHLISVSGKTLWKQKLDSQILGEIQEVDILRNGKKQMAFATKNTFHVLDRTGKPVAPFPIKFKDPITQPLAVFDYDNKRKYRFVVTQDNEVYMYDAKGKTVKGFTFKKAKSTIVLPPKHIRLGNKDYIAIAEKSGKLNLLSRTGKSRVNVTKSFSFSGTPVMKEGRNFVVITSNNKKESISASGKVSTKILDVSGNYSFSVKGKTKITLDDNLLRIDNTLVELPFGIYTKPRAFYANKTTYVSITETQENKVYIYDKNGRLLSGFPLFGSSSAVIGNGAKKGKLRIAVKGGAKEVLLYSQQ